VRLFNFGVLICASLLMSANYAFARGEVSVGPNSQLLTRLPCKTVSGLLTYGNGTPGIRISPRGSHRILGVLDEMGDPEGRDILPRNVKEMMMATSPPSAIIGKFYVCPLTVKKSGWMQMVRLRRASHLIGFMGG
jgi:hypothetical protein